MRAARRSAGGPFAARHPGRYRSVAQLRSTFIRGCDHIRLPAQIARMASPSTCLPGFRSLASPRGHGLRNHKVHNKFDVSMARDCSQVAGARDPSLEAWAGGAVRQGRHKPTPRSAKRQGSSPYSSLLIPADRRQRFQRGSKFFFMIAADARAQLLIAVKASARTWSSTPEISVESRLVGSPARQLQRRSSLERLWKSGRAAEQVDIAPARFRSSR